MSDLPTIITLPPAPVPTDPPSEFATKAAAFVPTMSLFGDDINAFGEALEAYALLQIEKLTATLSATNHGLYDAVVVGDTDGVNTEFEILGIGFYPAWNLFVDGVKIAKDDMTINGSTITLSTAPVSGSSVEATGSRDYLSIAPEGYKTIWVTSNLNGTIEIDCTSDNDSPCTWRMQGRTDVESTSFSYTNDGSSVVIYSYIPDDMVNGHFDAGTCGVIGFNCDFGMANISRLTLRDNVELKNIDSLVGFSELNEITNMLRQTAITSLPVIDTSQVENFNLAFYYASLIDFPSLDYSSGTTFIGTWTGNNLNQESVDSILVKLDEDGVSNATIDMSLGTNATPSSAGLIAKTALESRGCTVNVN